MPFFSKGCLKLKRYLRKAELDQKEFADAADIQPDFLSHLGCHAGTSSNNTTAQDKN